MPRGKVSEPAEPATLETEAKAEEYKLTVTPYAIPQGYGGSSYGNVAYQAVLRYGEEVLDEWKVADEDEALYDAKRKKFAHQVKLGFAKPVEYVLGDEPEASYYDPA